MTDVVDDMLTVAGRRDNGGAIVRSAVLRPSNTTTGAVTPADHKFDIVNGQLRLLNLDPGPAEIFIRMGSWTMPWTPVSIPESATPITLRTLLDNYVEHEPGVVSEVREHADRAESARSAAEESANRADAAAVGVETVMASAADGVRALVAADADRAEQAATDAEADRVAAEGSAAAAYTSRQEAVQYATYASTVAGQAETHRDAALAAQAESETARDDAVSAKGDAVAAKAGAEAAQAAAETAAVDAASDVTAALEQAVAADRQAAETARTGAEAAATTAGGHKDAAEGFAAAADASATAADVARIAAEEAAANAQQGAPAGGWTKLQLEVPVQESLNRADTALQDMPTATQAARGGIKLAGDLTGTAESPQIAAGAVGSAKLANDAVTGTHIATGAVDFDQLSDIEPYPMNPSLQAAAGFAAEMKTAFLVNGGWERGNLTQDVQDDLAKTAAAVQGSANGVATAFVLWVGTEAEYNATTSNGTNESPGTVYLRGA